MGQRRRLLARRVDEEIPARPPYALDNDDRWPIHDWLDGFLPKIVDRTAETPAIRAEDWLSALRPEPLDVEIDLRTGTVAFRLMDARGPTPKHRASQRRDWPISSRWKSESPANQPLQADGRLGRSLPRAPPPLNGSVVDIERPRREIRRRYFARDPTSD
jgi:hypothetical protein